MSGFPRGLPSGHFELAWREREPDCATVVFIRDRRPRALTEAYFQRQIPIWRSQGVRVGIEPTGGQRGTAT